MTKGPKSVLAIEIACYHCGEECGKYPVRHDEKEFCCEGCKTVYAILDENGLCNYYKLDEAAGISLKGKALNRYTFLDDEDAKMRIVDFTDHLTTKVHFILPQIHCSACIWLLENLAKLNDGIVYSRVNFLKKEIDIQYEELKTSLRKVVELLTSIGYAPIINLDKLDDDKDKAVDKRLYYKLGLAGFAFGNIMLLSFPEYLGLDPSVDTAFAQFFGYLNLVLILPVILYSGQDYLYSAWLGLKQRHLNIDVPVSLGIMALFGRSAYEIISQVGAGYLDSLAGLIFFLLIGKWYQQKTYYKLSFERDYKSYFPIAATVIRDDQEKIVTIDKLVAGDLILIRHGEIIPTDGILMQGTAKIDYSFVTGESKPVAKVKGDKIFAGGRQRSGVIELCVIDKVDNSYLTKLWNDDAFHKTSAKGKASELGDRVAGYFTWAILIVGLGTMSYWLPKDVNVAFQAFTAVLIVACPCAVALSIPFTFGNVLRILGRQGLYLKNIQVIENLSRIKDIVFDKTGTITEANSAVVSFEGDSMSEEEKSWVKSVTNQSAHPLSRWIDTSLQNVPILNVTDFNESVGLGISGFVQGHKLFVGSRSLVAKAGSVDYGDDDGVFVKIDEKVKGYYRKEGSFRTALSSMVTKLKERYTLSLLTGDNSQDERALAQIFGAETQLLYNQSPQDKLLFIKRLQSDGRSAMMIGDGLNDAGALKQSNVGIVITENTSNFTPACDAILDASKFDRLIDFLDFGRQSIWLVYAAYLIALIYNLVGLSFAVQGLLSPVIAAILMPASSVSIVLFGIGSSSWLAKRFRL